MPPDYAVAAQYVGSNRETAVRLLPADTAPNMLAVEVAMRGVIRIFLVLIIGVAAVLAVLVTIFVLGDSKDLAVSFASGDDGRVVTLADGDRFDVALPGNPSTGYTWVAVVNESVVRQVGDIDFTADSDLIGAAGTMVLHFECVGPGTTEVSLEYIRPFEPNEPAADMFSVSITVAN